MGENGDKKGMTVKDYEKTEAYMLSCMNDSAHDKEHVYRVLYYALEIAKPEPDVDYEILITSCLLHDIGRKEQFENPGLCHARVGGDKAYAFLVGAGWTQERALRVKQAVAAHRYRSDNPPESIEAKILFDADKLDVTGWGASAYSDLAVAASGSDTVISYGGNSVTLVGVDSSVIDASDFLFA